MKTYYLSADLGGTVNFLRKNGTKTTDVAQRAEFKTRKGALALRDKSFDSCWDIECEGVELTVKKTKTEVVKDTLGRWIVVMDGVADKFNFFATKREALEFVKAEAQRAAK